MSVYLSIGAIYRDESVYLREWIEFHLLVGVEPKDFDVATDAPPNRIKRVFRNAFIIGRRFRLAHIRFEGGKVVEAFEVVGRIR